MKSVISPSLELLAKDTIYYCSSKGLVASLRRVRGNQKPLANLYVYNNCKICVSDVTIISNRFETDFETATGMRMEAMLKNCLKWKELCIKRY